MYMHDHVHVIHDNNIMCTLFFVEVATYMYMCVHEEGREEIERERGGGKRGGEGERERERERERGGGGREGGIMYP